MARIMGNGEGSCRLRGQNAPITVTRRICGAAEFSFLILHGYGYDGSVEHWHNRLTQALTAAGIPVRHPRFPSPDAPSLGEWRRYSPIEGAGHLNPDDGYGRWASCERWCLDPRERITA